jgi:thiamine biosynthesis lipoprotein
VAIEDPSAPDKPIAVLKLVDMAVATSSIRLRQWNTGGKLVHHLIDAQRGQPGGSGLVAVTVVAADPATAEVWSKALFLEGAVGIANAARRRAIAAFWVDDHGHGQSSGAMDRYLMWTRQ